MPVFVVIADEEHDHEVERAIEKEYKEHQVVRPGVWLIRTKNRTSSEAMEALGISKEMNALVVTAPYVTGWFESDVIEWLEAGEAP